MLHDASGALRACAQDVSLKCGWRKEDWAQQLCLAFREGNASVKYLSRRNLSPCQSKAHRNTCANCVHGQVMFTGHCTAVSNLSDQVVGQKLVLPLLVLAKTELSVHAAPLSTALGRALVVLPGQCLHLGLWYAASPMLAQAVLGPSLAVPSAGTTARWLGTVPWNWRSTRPLVQLASGSWHPHTKGRAEVRPARLILQLGCLDSSS